MTRIADSIVRKIKEEGVKPIDKRIFLLRNSFIWGLLGVSVLFGSLSFSIIIYMLESSDIQTFISLSDTPFEYLLLSVPILWIVLTIFSLVLGYINFLSTQEGYKFDFSRIFISNFIAIAVFGSILYLVGITSLFNNFLSENIDVYNKIADPRYVVWNDEERGQIAGDIVSVDYQAKTLSLEDLSGEDKNVDFSGAQVRSSVDLVAGSRVKVRGAMEENTFVATDILPWEGRGKHMQGNRF